MTFLLPTILVLSTAFLASVLGHAVQWAAQFANGGFGRAQRVQKRRDFSPMSIGQVSSLAAVSLTIR